MNVHAAVGIIIAMIFSSYLSDFEILYIIGVLVIIDFDYLLSRFAKNHNHRRLPTHTFFLYGIFILFGVLFFIFKIYIFDFIDLWRYIVLFGICGFIHVGMDSFDWGIMLFYPYSQNLIGGILKIPNTKNEQNNNVPLCYFIKTYYRSNIIKISEVIFGILAFISIVFINFNYYYILLLYFGTLTFHMIQFFKCKKEKN